MIGKQHVIVRNNRAQFEFTLNRNITIVKGNSGTGKTTLYRMIADHMRDPAGSGVHITSDKPCLALDSMNWKENLSHMEDSIVFIDEGFKPMRSQEFAKAVKHSSCYFVFFTRENLETLPYSIQEIYEITMLGRNKIKHVLVPLYKLDEHYGLVSGADSSTDYEILVTEDSGSGYLFFCGYLKQSTVECCSAKANSGIN